MKKTKAQLALEATRAVLDRFSHLTTDIQTFVNHSDMALEAIRVAIRDLGSRLDSTDRAVLALAQTMRILDAVEEAKILRVAKRRRKKRKAKARRKARR